MTGGFEFGRQETVIYDRSQVTKSEAYRWIFWFCSLSTLLWWMNLLFMEIQQSILQSYFVWIYMIYILYIRYWSAFVIKSIAGKLDAIRARHHKWNHFISVEFVVEMVMSFASYSYFVSILVNLGLYHSQNGDTSTDWIERLEVIQLVLVHFGFEILETSFKFSEKYYAFSSGVIHWINVRDDNCCCRRLYRIFGPFPNPNPFLFLFVDRFSLFIR